VIPPIVAFVFSAVVCVFAFPPDEFPMMYALSTMLMGWLLLTGDSGEP